MSNVILFRGKNHPQRTQEQKALSGRKSIQADAIKAFNRDCDRKNSKPPEIPLFEGAREALRKLSLGEQS